MAEVTTPLRSGRSQVWSGLRLAGLGIGLGIMLGACGGEGSNQLQPVELAFPIPDNFTSTGSFTAGTTTGFVEFDLRRLADDALITDPLSVLVLPLGQTDEQEILIDDLGNTIFLQRAVVLLGNGLDEDNDGVADVPPPESPPAPIQPMVPFEPPQGWDPSRTLAYTPNQTTVPELDPIPRFGFYASSVASFEAEIGLAVQDVLGQVVPGEVNITFPAAPTQSVTVSVTNATGTEENPIIVAICNQLQASLYVGLRSGATTTLTVPQVSATPDTPLNAPTFYVAQAYQFDSVGNLIQVSDNPTDPGNLSTLLLDSSGTGDGTAELSLISSTNEDLVTCAGDSLRLIPQIVGGFF